MIIKALEKVDPTFLFTVELQKVLREKVDVEAHKPNNQNSVGLMG